MGGQTQDYTHESKANLKASFYATKPTNMTRFMRTFLPWQIWRFLRINWKMLTIIHRSHETH